MRRLSLLGADTDVQIHTSTFKPVKSPVEREHLTVWLSTFWNHGRASSEARGESAFSQKHLNGGPKLFSLCGILLDLTQVEVGWGHMQMQWGMYRMERQWEGIMQGWITVDTWAAESLWMHKGLKCIKVWSGLEDYIGLVHSWQDRLNASLVVYYSLK